MGKKAKTGNPTPYTDTDEGDIESAMADAWADYGEDYDGGDDDGGGTPTRLFVEAEIEWAGTLNPQAHRATTFDHLELGAVRDALRDAQAAADAVRHARPAGHYSAKGWHAQLRGLLESSRGSAAADRAGLGPSARTVKAWLSEDRVPSKANRERIAEAYGSLRTWRVDEARDRSEAAAHAVTEALTDALRDRYGAEVRLRNITRLELEP